MTIEAEQLLAAALKKVDLRGGFSPAEVGAKIGLNELQSNTAARLLANAGVLVIGFDQSAEFSADFRKSRSPAPVKPLKAKKKAGSKKRSAVSV